MDTPHAPTGQDIWQALKQELRNNLYPLPSVTLAPSVYHVYLHPEDFEIVDGIVSRIVAEMVNELTKEVDRLNKESARRRGPLREWLQPDEAPPPVEMPPGGWDIHIQPDHDGELPRGQIGLVSKLTVPPRPEYGGTPTIRTVKAVFTEGRRSPAVEVSTITRPAATVRATLRYQDDAGDHMFPVRKELIKIGRGGSDAWVDVQVITTAKVSREHCWIRADANGRFFIRDVSTWGTFVNGQPIPSPARSPEGEVLEPGVERELPADAVITLADAMTIQFGSSDPSTLNEGQIAERGARMARRDDREYREYLREEQRSQPGSPPRVLLRGGVEEGCPAREVVLDQRGRATEPQA